MWHQIKKENPNISFSLVNSKRTKVQLLTFKRCLDLLYSLVLQGISILQQQKYIELFLVADNREVRYTHGKCV